MTTEYRHEFASWLEALEASQREKPGKDLINVSQASEEIEPDLFEAHGGADWYGTATFQEALDLAQHGWPEGAERISEMRDRLYAHLAEIVYRKENTYQRQGPGILNIKRYTSGHPAPYLTRRNAADTQEIERTRGILKIGLNISASAAISAETMFRRGAAIAALIDCLERAKFRVEFDIGHAVTRHGKDGNTYKATTMIRFKNAEDHLEPDALAFAAAHASSLRRIGFALEETYPVPVRRRLGFYSKGNYGHPAPCFQGNSEYDITLEEASYRDERWADDESAAKWVREILAAQGIEVLDGD